MTKETIFSPCRKYRYTLWREWQCDEMFEGCNEGERFSERMRQYVQFIGLNPSTADETNNDPTIRRCIDFAKRWGFGGLCMTNLFAFRATAPSDLKKESEPISHRDFDAGHDWNDWWISAAAMQAGLIVAAWGKDGAFLGRGKRVLENVLPGKSVMCLGVNSDGTPKHPLYLSKNSIPVPLKAEMKEAK